MKNKTPWISVHKKKPPVGTRVIWANEGSVYVNEVFPFCAHQKRATHWIQIPPIPEDK